MYYAKPSLLPSVRARIPRKMRASRTTPSAPEGFRSPGRLLPRASVPEGARPRGRPLPRARPQGAQTYTPKCKFHFCPAFPLSRRRIEEASQNGRGYAARLPSGVGEGERARASKSKQEQARASKQKSKQKSKHAHTQRIDENAESRPEQASKQKQHRGVRVVGKLNYSLTKMSSWGASSWQTQLLTHQNEHVGCE
jgi:hypothetical protein